MIKWRATLSDGTVATQDEGEWIENPGERLPWNRLCKYSAENGLVVDKLEVDIDGRLVYLPFDLQRFSLVNQKPNSFDIMYHMEVDNLLTGGNTSIYIDTIAHYKNFDLHLINKTDTTESWIFIT